jgi:hypothetical protein
VRTCVCVCGCMSVRMESGTVAVAWECGSDVRVWTVFSACVHVCAHALCIVCACIVHALCMHCALWVCDVCAPTWVHVLCAVAGLPG